MTVPPPAPPPPDSPPAIIFSRPVARPDLSRGFSAAHPGLDYNVPIGEPVFAAADGVVTASHYSVGAQPPKVPPPWAAGHMVVVQHGSRAATVYMHLSRRLVAVGQRVTRGELVGYSGNTGRVIPAPTREKPWLGQHLHFELLVDGRRVDPIPLLSPGIPAAQPLEVADLEHTLQAVCEDGKDCSCEVPEWAQADPQSVPDDEVVS